MNILYVVSKKDFRDEEYFIPKEMFEEHGFNVKTASIDVGCAISFFDKKIDVDIKLSDVDMKEYDAIVIAGGKGALTLSDNDDLKKNLYDAMKYDKIVAAICISPIILANCGLLQKTAATVWNEDGKQADILKQNGALYFSESVVIDKNIITANGPKAAKEFADSIIDALKSNN